MASGMAITALGGTTISPVQLARLGQRVGHGVIGVPTGIMDQLISAAGVRGSATLIDCRSLELRQAALPDSVRIVVLDTGTRRGLVDSEYAHRRAACGRVVGESCVRARAWCVATREFEPPAAAPRLDPSSAPAASRPALKSLVTLI